MGLRLCYWQSNTYKEDQHEFANLLYKFIDTCHQVDRSRSLDRQSQPCYCVSPYFTCSRKVCVAPPVCFYHFDKLVYIYNCHNRSSVRCKYAFSFPSFRSFSHYSQDIHIGFGAVQLQLLKCSKFSQHWSVLIFRAPSITCRHKLNAVYILADKGQCHVGSNHR